VLNEWNDFLIRHFPCLQPNLIVYLKISAESAHQRILSRKRKEESSLTLDTLTEINNCYENWIGAKRTNLDNQLINKINCPVFEIDASLSEEIILKQFEKIIEENFKK